MIKIIQRLSMLLRLIYDHYELGRFDDDGPPSGHGISFVVNDCDTVLVEGIDTGNQHLHVTNLLKP